MMNNGNWGNGMGPGGHVGPMGNQMGYGDPRMNQNQGMGNPYGGQRKPRKPGKQEIINWFRGYTGAPELDLIDDSFDEVARHVCMGGNTVELLPKRVFMFQWEGGQIPLEYYQCLKCGKVMLNRNFM